MRYLFADCVLDTQLYTLSRAGTPIPLRPKVFQVLCYFIEHRDHVVSKDELCTQVWPDRFISYATLESCIRRVRQALVDSWLAQQFIETRRGHGYRFVGVVEAQAAPSPEGEVRASPLEAPASFLGPEAPWEDEAPAPDRRAELPDAPPPPGGQAHVLAGGV